MVSSASKKAADVPRTSSERLYTLRSCPSAAGSSELTSHSSSLTTTTDPGATGVAGIGWDRLASLELYD